LREVRWGARTLDIDVIAVGDLLVDDRDLELPHPRAAERAFVLVPWLDVDSAAELPGAGAVADLLEPLDRSGVRRRGDLDLVVPE
jgi:2-amino-4-hydroxy-6-hydroxymethyldihydropteridine diphosphokinase